MSTIVIKDQLEAPVLLTGVPTRIVCLVPSLTKLLIDMGLTDKLVGRTKFCIHPKEVVETIAEVGGTKNPRLDEIKALAPDFVLMNQEENMLEDANAIKLFAPVYVSNIKKIADQIDLTLTLGKLFGIEAKALELNNQLFNNYKQLPDYYAINPTCLYLVWRRPYMAAGTDTFIAYNLEKAGFRPIPVQTRYPIVTDEQIAEWQPDLIFLSSEPYPFREKHKPDFLALAPKAKVELVDGELFSWYGSKMIEAPAYFTWLRQRLGLGGA